MKKIISVFISVILILSFASCGNTAQTGSKSYDEYYAMDISDLKQEIHTIYDGILTVATSPDFAPYEFYTVNEKGEYSLAGFDMGIAQYIADYLGLTLDVIPMDFDGTLAELSAKRVDVTLAGLSPDPSRMDKMDFSDIYYTGGQSFCVAKKNENLFTKLSDADSSQYEIGAQTGSIQYNLALENTPNADIVQVTKVTDIIADLLKGNLTGAFIETAVAETYAKSYPDLIVKFGVPYDAEGSCAGVCKGNFALLAGINQAIEAALADGSMDAIIAKAYDDSTGNIFEGIPE